MAVFSLVVLATWLISFIFVPYKEKLKCQAMLTVSLYRLKITDFWSLNLVPASCIATLSNIVKLC